MKLEKEGGVFIFLTLLTLKSLRVVFISTQLCCLLNLHKQYLCYCWEHS